MILTRFALFLFSRPGKDRLRRWRALRLACLERVKQKD